MKRYGALLKAGMLVAAAGLLAAGCAGAPVDKTLRAEELLGTAGFRLRAADTPEALERISRIPQKRVVRGMVKDREIFVWADATGCRCYYSGIRQNFERLNELRKENRAQHRADLYDAQDNEPLWLGDDWEDELLGFP
jgi:hypothetical protein